MAKRAKHRWGRNLTRLAISGLLLVFFGLHVQGTLHLELIDRIESYLYDARVRLTMPDTIDDRIVIVDIDEASLAKLGQWPWPRDVIARIVDTLFDDYGIRILGFDVLFAEKEESSGERVLDELANSDIGAQPEVRREIARLRETLGGDLRLAEALIARDVVTGFVFKATLGAGEFPAKGALPPVLLGRSEIDGLDIPFVEAKGYVGNLVPLQENAVSGGFFDSPLIDPDGVFRRAPLLQQYDGELYPSLALAVARLAAGSPPVGFVFAETGDRALSGLALEQFRLGERTIPVDEQVAVLIPFRGPPGSFNYVSAQSVIDKSAAKDILKNKIVLFGATAPGLFDLRSTPVAELFFGVEAHANLIAGILDGSIKQQPSYTAGLELSVLFVLALLTALLLPRLAPLPGFLLVIGIVFLTLAGNLWLWSAQGLVVPLASPLSYIFIAALLQMNYGYFVESRNKRRLSRLFGQYIPPRLVEEMDAGGAELSLEGENRRMSVLFSDVRGFTSISEKLDARELTRLMNEFLTPITRVIHDHRGTIDKYMGDAVMAFWGAPLEDPEHARHAVLAGLAMIEKVKALATPFAARGWPPIAVGVGVASGEMNVGNMGSEFRMAYTVMGDTVNLGSRLEGLTKQYGVGMIVSEATMREAPDVLFRELDLVRVKGKTEPVAIYQPLGLRSGIDEQIAAATGRFAEALACFRTQSWDEATAMLEELNENAADPLYEVYLERIRSFRRGPPMPGWDGVFDHLSK